MEDKLTAEDVLRNLVETIMEGESGGEIDAGCDGEGPLAQALVFLGMADDEEKATDMIYGDYEACDAFFDAQTA